MIFHFILNPHSGKRKKIGAMEASIKNACRKRNLDYHIYYTTCPGDATEYVRSMVRSSKEKQRFICIGGDGTINEIVNSAPCIPHVEFGVIPHGSGNDFVRNFGDTEIFHDIEAQIDGESVSLDLIKCNEHYCVNMVNIGFDCEVVKAADKFKKLSPKLSYILGIVAVLFKRIGTKMKLIFDDGEVRNGELTLTAIANGKFCGGGFMAAPTAELDDGMLDMCIIKRVSRLRFLSLVGCYKKGRHLENKKAQRYITLKRVSHLRMEFEKPLPICIDGEIKGAKNVEFTLVRNAFNFVIPKKKKF